MLQIFQNKIGKLIQQLKYFPILISNGWVTLHLKELILVAFFILNNLFIQNKFIMFSIVISHSKALYQFNCLILNKKKKKKKSWEKEEEEERFVRHLKLYFLH